jgi:D-alanyl-D-alanine carboxypeptidase
MGGLMFRWSLSCAWLVVACATLGAVPTRQGPDPQVRARIEAFVAALSSGTAEAYEAMARDAFMPALLAKRTADERRQFVEQVRGDFGKLTFNGARTTDGETFSLRVTGATGMKGEIRLTLEASPPRRIVAIAMEAGTRADDEALPPAPVDPTLAPSELSKRLDAYISPLEGDGRFAGVVLAARNGAPVFEKAYGQADREKKLPAATTTRYSIGSINKIFTKICIARLVAEGRLSLGDTIGKLLPDHPNVAARPATVDQLLNHQAGIADFFGPAFEQAPKTQFRSNADYYRFVAPMPLTFAPGTGRQYCNGCYIVLGAIVERVSGVRYEDYVAEHVFKPAGMKTAGFFHSDRLPSGVAIGYTRRGPGGGNELRANGALHGAAGSAAGGAYASAADLLALDTSLRDGRLLDAKMTGWVLGGDATGAGRARGGLSIAGGAPGVNALLESDGEWTIVVLANLDPPAAEQLGTAISRNLIGSRSGK